MEFDFDPRKSRRNLERHGMDFTTAQRLWDGPHIIVPAKHVAAKCAMPLLAGLGTGSTLLSLPSAVTLQGSLARTGPTKDGRGNSMNTSKKTKRIKTISARTFDAKFDRGEDIFPYLDFDKAIVVKRVNVDFPTWMIHRLDKEASKLNVSRQAIIKMWVHEHLTQTHARSR